MKEDLLKKIDNFSKSHILVMGDLILDKFSWGEVERINPEQPAAPLVKIVCETLNIGGAGNVANNITSLGGNCSLYGVVGKDNYGKELEKLIRSIGIKFTPFYSEMPTLVKQRIMAHKQEVTRIDYGENDLKKIGKDLEEKILFDLNSDINHFDLIVLSDYNKHFFSRDLSRKIIYLSNKSNIKIISDPKPINAFYFKDSYIISPNRKEAEEISGIDYSKENLLKIAKNLKKKLNTKGIIITCGEEGVFVYKNEEQNRLIPTSARDVSNPTGAGDTFIAAFSLGISSGLDFFESAEIANYSAGIVVEKPGTALSTKKELIKSIKRNQQ